MFILLVLFSTIFPQSGSPSSGGDFVLHKNYYATVHNVAIKKAKNGNTHWDSVTDAPDPLVRINLNNQISHSTGFCSNTFVCDCPSSCGLQFTNVTAYIGILYVQIYDHDIAFDDLVTSFVDYLFNIGDSRRTWSNDIAQTDITTRVETIYQPCTERTPLSGGNCATLSENYSGCYLETSNNSCVLNCAKFYSKQDGQRNSDSQATYGKCVPQNCKQRVPEDGKCRSINDTTPEQMTCGYLAGNANCVYCPSKHYTASADGICNLKSCSTRVVDASSSTPCNASCNKQPNGTCNTGCPNNYVGVDGMCTLQNCSERKVLSSSNTYPCEDGDCFQQLDPAGDGTRLTNCNTACGGNLSVADRTTGKCELKVCEERTLNVSHDFPCGDSSCLRVTHDEDSSGNCASSCNEAHFILSDTNCHAMVCEERRKIDGTSPCGPGECYWDQGNTETDSNPNPGKCRSSCTNDKHFKKQESNHTCILMDCSERQENLTAGGDWPCVPRDSEPLECYANAGRDDRNGGTECATACSNSEHYELDPKVGRCVEKECENRTRSSSDTAPCGSGVCYLDMNAYAEMDGGDEVYGHCRLSCTNPDHFAPDTATGKCVERECKFRTTNTSETVPCGSGYCFADPGAGPNMCKDMQHVDADNETNNETSNETNNELAFDDACTHPTHYELVEARHRCIIRKCIDRERDDTAAYICGEQPCFLQPPGADHGCDEECPSHYKAFYNGESLGACKLVNCLDRTPAVQLTLDVNGSFIHPLNCRSNDDPNPADDPTFPGCFALMEDEHSIPTCLPTCPDTHTSDDTGVCVKKRGGEEVLKSKSKAKAVWIIVPIVAVVLAIAAVIIIILIHRKIRKNKSGSGASIILDDLGSDLDTKKRGTVKMAWPIGCELASTDAGHGNSGEDNPKLPEDPLTHAEADKSFSSDGPPQLTLPDHSQDNE